MVCGGYIVSVIGFRWQLYYRKTLTSIEEFVERSVIKNDNAFICASRHRFVDVVHSEQFF